MSPELLAVRQERVRLLAATLAAETGIPVSDILGSSKEAAIVAVRHRLWSMLRETGLSLPALAAVLGRNHTTILAGIRRHAERTGPASRERPVAGSDDEQRRTA